MYIANLFENYVTEAGTQLVVLFPGRFQPFHLGHKEVFEKLQSKFGRENVWISTSNKTELPKSPFDFNDKIQLMTAAGISADRILESPSPYKLPPQFNPQNTIFIVAVGEPDRDRLRPDTFKKDGNPSYYKSFKSLDNVTTADEHGYVIIANEREKIIKVGGEPVDVSHGTQSRAVWNLVRNDPKKRAEFLLQMYGRADEELGRILDKIPQDINETADPELAKTIDYAVGHYPNIKDRGEAFMKFVQRSLKHGLETDIDQQKKINDLTREIETLKKKISDKKVPQPELTEDSGLPNTNSNGRPIANSPEALSNFWNWFNESKVVDANGKPLVVYHGTGADFDSFILDKIGEVFNDDSHGFFFTLSREDASRYAKHAAEKLKGSANVMPVYLSIKNPYTFKDFAYSYYYDQESKSLASDITDGRLLIDWFDRNKDTIVQHAIEDDKDGMLFVRNGEVLAVAFSPKQIKSAIGNTGNYSTQSNDIVAEEAAGVGVVKNSKDPRYSMATMGDQNDVDGDTLGKSMAAFGLVGRKPPKTSQKAVAKDIGKGKIMAEQTKNRKIAQTVGTVAGGTLLGIPGMIAGAQFGKLLDKGINKGIDYASDKYKKYAEKRKELLARQKKLSEELQSVRTQLKARKQNKQ